MYIRKLLNIPALLIFFILLVMTHLSFAQEFSQEKIELKLKPDLGLHQEAHLKAHLEVKLKLDQEQILSAQAPKLNRKALEKALSIYSCYTEKGSDRTDYLAIIDYSRPSNEKRLWIFDMRTNRLIMNTWVAHGTNSGGLYAKSFSNKFESHKSSIGVYQSDLPYVGKAGYSLKIKGLTPGFNDNAYHRHVVIHGAWYISQNFISKYGRIGRTWGCPAVSNKLAREVINIVKKGTVLVAYYPDEKWLKKPFRIQCT